MSSSGAILTCPRCCRPGPCGYHGATHFRKKYAEDFGGTVWYDRWFVHGRPRFRDGDCCGSLFGGHEAREANEDLDCVLDLFEWSALEKSLDMLPPIPAVPADAQDCGACQKPISRQKSCELCANYRNDAVYSSSACMEAHRPVHSRTCLGRTPDPQREPVEQFFDWVVRSCEGREVDWEDDNADPPGLMEDGSPADPMIGVGAVMDAFRRLDEKSAYKLFKESKRWRTFFLHSFRRALLGEDYDSGRHPSVRMGESMCLIEGYAAVYGLEGIVRDGWAIDAQDAKIMVGILGIRTGSTKGLVPEKYLEAWCLRPEYCTYQRDYDADGRRHYAGTG